MSAKLIGALKKTAWVILIFLCAAFVIRARGVEPAGNGGR